MSYHLIWISGCTVERIWFIMRSKKAVLIASFLCVWTLITYILFMRQTLDFDSKQQHLQNKLNYLEASIQEENELHESLLHKFISAVRQRDDSQLVTSSSTTLASQNAGKTQSKSDEIHERQNGVKEIPLVDNNIPNQNRHNLSLIQKQGNGDFKGPVIPVVVFACNRVSVRNCLENLVQHRPNAEQFPIIVSQVSKYKTETWTGSKFVFRILFCAGLWPRTDQKCYTVVQGGILNFPARPNWYFSSAKG